MAREISNEEYLAAKLDVYAEEVSSLLHAQTLLRLENAELKSLLEGKDVSETTEEG